MRGRLGSKFQSRSPSLLQASGRGEVRIIGGQWKRSRLPIVQRPDLRPTPDRVRETLFNWLGQDLSGWRCVDAFAGSGVLGFEAASRGAADVLLCERDALVVARLEATRERLGAGGVRIEHGDGIAALRSLRAAGVDLVFLDPPFNSSLHAEALLAASAAIGSHAFVYLEAAELWQPAPLARAGLTVARHLRAGGVHAHLLVRAA